MQARTKKNIVQPCSNAQQTSNKKLFFKCLVTSTNVQAPKYIQGTVRCRVVRPGCYEQRLVSCLMIKASMIASEAYWVAEPWVCAASNTMHCRLFPHTIAVTNSTAFLWLAFSWCWRHKFSHMKFAASLNTRSIPHDSA